ncbi:MAG: hypothetical protein EXX96DRAFT_369736 [Benjaminiella poitrasii]|nr:MAG: hypothetical protein EXX96DRAFT_369736 [Benjaminiella poitrasii]
MDKLPTELLLRCISQLPVSDKLSCLTVNKSWYTNIRKFGKLYERIWIYNRDSFDKMCAFFQNHSDLAETVDSLTLMELGLQEDQLIGLPSLFLNLHEFNFIQENMPIEKWDKAKIQNAFSVWAPKLKFIQELGTPMVTPVLLETNQLPELVSLNLSFLGYEDERLKTKFFVHLNKAPQLTVLRVQWLNVSMKDLQGIHNRVPRLKALSFDNCGFLPEKQAMAAKPAIHLETLSLENCAFALKEDDWLDYFTNKYKNLKNFIMTYCEDDHDYEGRYWSRRDSRFNELVLKCPKIEYFLVHAFELPKDIFKKMDEGGVKLKQINLGIYDPQTDFERLLMSSQIETIESLSISGISWSSLTFENKETEFLNKLAKFPNLKHLRINQSKVEVDSPETNLLNLDLLLSILNNLESLTVDFTTLTFSRKTRKGHNAKLKKLVMEESYAQLSACKDQDEALEYLQKTLLSNTEFVIRWLDDESPNEEYRHLFEYSYYQ